MATKTFCDNCETEITEPYGRAFGDPPVVEVTSTSIARGGGIYCSPTCAIIALGGTDQIVDAQVYGYDPDSHSLTLPWPPDADADRRMRAVLNSEFGPFLAHDPHNPDAFWGQAARALFDAIGTEASE